MLAIDANALFYTTTELADAYRLHELMRDPQNGVYSVVIGGKVCQYNFKPRWGKISLLETRNPTCFLVRTESDPEGVTVYGRITNGYAWAFPNVSLETAVRIRYIEPAMGESRDSEFGVEIFNDPILSVEEIPLGENQMVLTNPILGMIINGFPTR